MKTLIDKYIFDASEKTIQIQGIAFTLPQVLLITNVTDQIIIYNFADTALGATLYNDTLTLDYNTASMDDTDSLQIYLDIPEEKEYDNKENILSEILNELKVMSFLLSGGEDVTDIREQLNNIKE